jgi:hypothetical protein
LAHDEEIQKMSLKEQTAAWGFQATEIFYCEKVIGNSSIYAGNIN